MNSEENKIVEENTESMLLEEEYAVVSIPTNTVELTIGAKIYIDGELKEAHKIMNMQDIRKAVSEAEEFYIPEDAVFTLTDEGRKYAETLENN